MTPGAGNLITDVAGLRVGNAQDAGLKSGVTVLTGDAPFTAAVAIMGGAPGTARQISSPPTRRCSRSTRWSCQGAAPSASPPPMASWLD